MKQTPLVSIIINNYNYGRFLPAAIDSALNQTYTPIEVIVVDDGSTDNSRSVIDSYSDKIKTVFKENGGQASAFNTGFAASRGEIICFLDADDIYLLKKTTEIVKTFQQHQDIDWCFHDVQLVQDDGKTKIENSHQNSSGQCDLRENIKQGKVLTSTSNWIIPPTSGLCFTRSLLQQILPMPDSIKITSDSYLQHAAIALGKGFILGKPLVLQRIHGNNYYTMNTNQSKIQAKVYILTGYWLKQKFPILTKLTNKFIARGLGLIWSNQIIDIDRELINDYFNSVSFLEKIIIRLRAIYYFTQDYFSALRQKNA